MFLAIASTLFLLASENQVSTRVFPPMQVADVAIGGACVDMTVEIKGPETEEWYCPRVTWVFPDQTESMTESDCAPFEKRNECLESQEGCGRTGWYRHPTTGQIVDKVKECSCTITGYPRIWRLRKCAPAHPKGDAWEVRVRFENGRKVLRWDTIRFWIK